MSTRPRCGCSKRARGRSSSVLSVPFEASALASLVPAEDDTLTHMPVSVIDITKRTQAEKERAILEEQLRHAQRVETIGRLASGISHDINNLLTPILGNSEILLMDDAGAVSRRDAAEQILGAARRIHDLTSKLLAFGRKQRLSRQVVELRSVVAEFTKPLRRTLRGNMEIRFVDGRGDDLVQVDVGSMEQVLMNLAVNAQDAMPEGGVLTLVLGREIVNDSRSHHDLHPGEYATLSVADTGAGMDDATREHIFEPFFTTKPPGEGTGLGLSVVYGIVKQHRGVVRVDSTPGLGAVFTILLPLFRRGAS